MVISVYVAVIQAQPLWKALVLVLFQPEDCVKEDDF